MYIHSYEKNNCDSMDKYRRDGQGRPCLIRQTWADGPSVSISTNITSEPKTEKGEGRLDPDDNPNTACNGALASVLESYQK